MKKSIIILLAAMSAIMTGCADRNAAESDTAFPPAVKSALNGAVSSTKICYGQGYETDGKNRPVGAINAQKLYGGLGGMFIGDENEKVIYLTFDEGYENGCTAEILDILKEKGVSATFYVTLDYVKTCPELVARMINEGHSVGNHTCTHPSLADCGDEEVFEEINRLEQYISDNFGGYKTKTVRPPKGEFSQRTLQICSNMGYKTVLWSFAYCDWDINDQPEKNAAFRRITGAAHNGAIYLLHAVSKTNTELLPDIIDFFSENGYEIRAI